MEKKILSICLLFASSLCLFGFGPGETSKIEAMEEVGASYKLSLHPEQISSSIFNVTMPSNDITCLSKGEYSWYSTLTPSNNLIGVNYVQTELNSFYLEKHPDNYYRVYLGMEANEGDVFTLGGDFVSPSIGTISIATSQFRFNGTSFEQFEPEIEIVSNENVEADGDTIYVNNGTSISELTARITNSFSGEISFSYPDGSIVSNKFISNEGKKEFDGLKVYCLSNGYTFEYEYRLVVGYKDFVSLKGAGVDYSPLNKGGLEFNCVIPSNIYTKAKEIGFLSLKKKELAGKELNVDSIFLHNDFFTFNYFEKGKININKTFPLIDKSNGEYILKGRILDIEEDSYFDEYIGLFYLKDEYGYFLANNVDDYSRSVVSSTLLALDNLDEHSNQLRDKYSFPSNKLAYKVKYISSDNNSILKEEIFEANLNDKVSIEPKTLNIGGNSYRFKSNKTVTKKIDGENIEISIYAEPFNQSINIYAYNCPTLSPRNRYDNSYNQTICNYLKQYGFTGVIYAGSNIGTDDNIEALKDIISMFYKNGLTTIINDKSYGSSHHHYYQGVPDFSNESGFDGFLSYDEPDTDSFDFVNSLAISYQGKYEFDYSSFITTLLPSYGKSYNEYEDYVNAYTSAIFSSLTDNELRSVCTDFYPFYQENGSITLRETYFNDLIYYSSLAKQFKAKQYLIMQLSEVDMMNRGTYYSEMLLQSFMALGFGFKNIVWYETFSSSESSLFVFDSGYDESTHEPKFHISNLDYIRDVGSINLLISNVGSLLSNYTYKGSYASSILGNYRLRYSSRGSLASYLSSLPDEIKIKSSKPYHVGVYSDGVNNVYIISSILNNDEVNANLSIDTSKDIYLNDAKVEMTSFSNLAQGQSIILV